MKKKKKEEYNCWYIDISIEPYKGDLRNSQNMFNFEEAKKVEESLSEIRNFMCNNPRGKSTQKMMLIGQMMLLVSATNYLNY